MSAKCPHRDATRVGIVLVPELCDHHIIALCPTCHRRVHHGEDGSAYNAEVVAELEGTEPK